MKVTQKIVREFLTYNQHTGVLTWRFRRRKWFDSTSEWKRWNTRYAGEPAFKAINGEGYQHGAIFHKNYKAHRIIWLWMTGCWPNPEVDHINRNRTDNRWINLSNQNNRRNISLYKNNTTNVTGVSWYPHYKKWLVRIGNGKSRQFLGYFPSFTEAVRIRHRAERKYGYSSTHGT
jgi:hypothetical protein